MQSQRPVLKQVQKLKMTPQLYQAVRLMALPLAGPAHHHRGRAGEEPGPPGGGRQVHGLPGRPARAGKSEGDGDYFDHSSDTGYSRADAEAASDARRQFIEGALSLPESLQEHLLAQLALQPIPEEWMTVGELLIRNLDENGFHRNP